MKKVDRRTTRFQGEKMRSYSIRLTVKQREKLRSLGGNKAIRAWLDSKGRR